MFAQSPQLRMYKTSMEQLCTRKPFDGSRTETFGDIRKHRNSNNSKVDIQRTILATSQAPNNNIQQSLRKHKQQQTRRTLTLHDNRRAIERQQTQREKNDTMAVPAAAAAPAAAESRMEAREPANTNRSKFRSLFSVTAANTGAEEQMTNSQQAWDYPERPESPQDSQAQPTYRQLRGATSTHRKWYTTMRGQAMTSNISPREEQQTTCFPIRAIPQTIDDQTYRSSNQPLSPTILRRVASIEKDKISEQEKTINRHSPMQSDLPCSSMGPLVRCNNRRNMLPLLSGPNPTVARSG